MRSSEDKDSLMLYYGHNTVWHNPCQKLNEYESTRHGNHRSLGIRSLMAIKTGFDYYLLYAGVGMHE